MEPSGNAIIVKYIFQFYRSDISGAILFCKKWDGTNGISFKARQPEDFVIEVLTGIYKGKKCYLNTYKHFRGSVYFHLHYKMLTHFKCKKNDNINEESVDNYFICQNKNNRDEIEKIGDFGYDPFAESEHKEFIEYLFGLLEPVKDIEEINYMRELSRGGNRNSIAETLGVSIARCNEIKRRLKRKLLRRLGERKVESLPAKGGCE